MSGVLDESNSNIENKLLSVIQNQYNWDINVYIGERELYCQFAILKMYSHYFRHCKVEDTYEIRLPKSKVTRHIFNIFYQWMF